MARQNITLGEKVRLINYLVENKNRLQDLGLPQLSEHVKSHLGIMISPAALGCTYRIEAGYSALRGEVKRSTAQEIADLRQRIEVVEALLSFPAPQATQEA